MNPTTKDFKKYDETIRYKDKKLKIAAKMKCEYITEAFLKLSKKEWSPERIGNKFGVSDQTIRNKFKEMGHFKKRNYPNTMVAPIKKDIDFEKFDIGIKKRDVALEGLKANGYGQYKYVSQAFYELKLSGITYAKITEITGYLQGSIAYHLRLMGQEVPTKGGKVAKNKEALDTLEIYRKKDGKVVICYHCGKHPVLIGDHATCRNEKCMRDRCKSGSDFIYGGEHRIAHVYA